MTLSAKDGGAVVELIGELDAALIAAEWKNVKSRVVLTDERKAHILEGHRDDYLAYGAYMRAAIERPRFILVDRKNAYTALYIGDAGDTGLTVVVRVAIEEIDAGKNSSVITMYRCGAKRAKRLVQNNTCRFVNHFGQGKKKGTLWE